jgi:hypothetical protein
MQVTLNIDANLAGSVAEVFAELTPADKKQLALAVMEKFIAEPHKAEREAFENSLILRLQTSGVETWVNGRYQNTKDAHEIRQSTAFKDASAKFKSTRETLIEEIIKATIETYRAEVKRVVESDPQIQAVKERVIAAIREDFPKYVHDAMAAWFVSGLTSMQSGMMAALMQAGNAEQFSKSIAQKLQLPGAY